MLKPTTIKFLQQLKRNNNKEWFDKNRPLYEAAKLDFLQFIDSIIQQFGRKDPTIASLEAKNLVFRINRDVRFSKDKSPYKSNMGASIAQGGKKSILAGYYFHLEPGESFVGGGLWMPMPPELKKIRQEIDYEFDAFRAIINHKDFKSVYGKLDDSAVYKLTRPPRDYDEENPAIEYIKLKSFIAMAPLTTEDLTSKELTKKVLKAFAALKPLLDFLNRGLV